MFLITVITIALAAPEIGLRVAPNAQYIDARAISQMRQIAPNALLVTVGGVALVTASDAASNSASTRHRIDLKSDCDASESGASLLAKDGWLCGSAREFLRTPTQMRGVAGIRTLSAREYADLSRTLDHTRNGERASVLDPVESRASRVAKKAGFRGTAEYCFRPSRVRNWSADAEGFMVKTAKSHSGGFGTYRVELGGSCPEIAYLSGLSWRSGVGLDVIWGHRGDAAVLSQVDDIETINPDTEQAYSLVVGILGHAQARSTGSIAERGCMVAAVYPIDP